jgi:hypothetical protein
MSIFASCRLERRESPWSRGPTGRATALTLVPIGVALTPCADAAASIPPVRSWIIGGAEISRNIDVDDVDGARGTDVDVWPDSLAATSDGTLWIAEQDELLRLDPAGRLHATGISFAPDLDPPQVTALASGDVAVTAGSSVLRVRADGSTSVLAGGGTEPVARDRPQPATSVRLTRAVDVAAAPDGSLIVADVGQLLRVATDGTLTTIAGDGSSDVDTG